MPARVDFFVFLHRHRAALRARRVGELGHDPTRAEALRRYHHAFAHICVVRAHARRRRSREAIAADLGSRRGGRGEAAGALALRRLKAPAFAGGAHGTRWHEVGANAKLKYSSKPRERRPGSTPPRSI